MPLRTFFLPERGVLLPAPHAVIAAVGLAAGVALATLSVTQRLEWSIYDRMMTMARRDPQPPPDIVVVAIDDPSFSELQTAWPWPRRLHAALIDALTKAGARTIAFDIVFDQPSTPEDDALLVDALRRARNVVLASDRVMTADRSYRLEQWVDPLAPFAEAAAAVGAVSTERDPDNAIRRAPALVDGRPRLALASALRQPGFSAPSDPDRIRLIRFLGPPRRGIVTVSYYQVIEAGLLPPGMFRDKIVLVGLSLSAAADVELPDQFSTPVAVRMPGVEVHASELDSLLRRRFVADPFGSYRASIGWAVAFGLIAALTFFYLTPHRAVIAFVTTAAALIVAAYVGLAFRDLRIPVVGPLLAAGGVLVSSAAYRFALGQRERRLIKRAFQHYLAPAIVQQLLDDPSRLTLGGEAKEVTIIFTDLEGFTSVAEHMAPEELRARLSAYFKAMMDVLLAERATLDKFIGDAIMVYFGCPVPDPAHPQQGCRGALAMQRRLDALNQEWSAGGGPALRMRIGVNTGIAVAGNMGTDEIFNYTIIGDCVNLASRLEAVNKAYGTRTIVGEDTWVRVEEEFEARELDWIRVKGKLKPVAIYELLAETGGLSEHARATRDRFAEGLALYRAGRFREAGDAFASALAVDPADSPSQIFLERCAYYAETPPAQWDGVHVMHTK